MASGCGIGEAPAAVSATGMRTPALVRATDRILDAAASGASPVQAAASAAVAEIADWCAVDLLRADGRLERVASGIGAGVDPEEMRDSLVRFALPEPALLERVAAARGPVRIDDPDWLGQRRAVAAAVAAAGESHGLVVVLLEPGERAVAEELWFAAELGLRLAQVLELSGGAPAGSDMTAPVLGAFGGKRTPVTSTGDRAVVVEPGRGAAAPIEARLRRAAHDESFRALLEPIAAVDGGEIAAAELIVEVPGTEPAHLRPAQLNELGDRGLVAKVHPWIRAQACRVAAELELRGPPIKVCLGLPADPGTAGIADLRLALEAAGGSPGSIILGLPGAAARTLARRGAELKKLRDAGFLVAIDDFGSGSALPADLLESSVDVLKLSRSLVAGAGHDAPRAERLAAVAELARDLGLDLVAQGVGSEAELAFVRELGCRWAQGEAIGRPRGLGDLVERAGARQR